MKKVITAAVLAVLLFIPFSQPLYAQTAARLEALLGKTELTWAEMAAFVLEAADVGTYGSADGAFNAAMQNKWLPKKAESGGTARLDGAALLLMRSFGLKGGLFYSMAKSPHHAYRELVHKKVIREGSDPRMGVSGSDLLLMVGRLLAIKEKAAGGSAQ